MANWGMRTPRGIENTEKKEKITPQKTHKQTYKQTYEIKISHFILIAAFKSLLYSDILGCLWTVQQGPWRTIVATDDEI